MTDDEVNAAWSWALNQPSINAIERAVLSVLTLSAIKQDEQGFYCFVTHAQLASISDFSRSSVLKHVGMLEEKKLIERLDRRGGRYPTFYRVCYPAKQQEVHMGAIFRIENMAESERVLWECVPADKYAGDDEIIRKCHEEGVSTNRSSLMAKLHAMRKCGYVDGHERQGRWLWRRNDPRVRHISPALVGVKAPETPKPSPVMLLKSEIAEAAQAALDLAARLDKLQAGLTHLAESQDALNALVNENARLKKELDAFEAMRTAFRALNGG